MSAEQKLWQNVVAQAVRDTFSVDPDKKRSAWSWFYSNSNDYRWVCSMAEVVPEKLRRTLIEYAFFSDLIKKGKINMNKVEINILKDDCKIEQPFERLRQTKAIFRAIYSRHELDKAIGDLTLNDILNICEQSDIEYKKLLNLED